MKNGKIDWQKVDQQVSQLVTSAVESVAGALRQRYYNDDGDLAGLCTPDRAFWKGEKIAAPCAHCPCKTAKQ